MRLLTALILSIILFSLGCSPTEENTDQANTVTVRLEQNPETLNPISYSQHYTFLVSNFIYQSLITIDYRTGTLKPQLALELPEVEAVDSGFLYHYQIRPEASWDEEHPVTAEDIAFTIKLFYLPGLNNTKSAVLYQFIRGLVPHPTNPKRFAIFCESGADDLRLLTGDFSVLPRHLFDPENATGRYPLHQLVAGEVNTDGDETYERFKARFNDPGTTRDSTMINGSHAYKLARWETDKYIVLERKRPWWGDEAPAEAGLSAYPDRIVFLILPDNNTALLMLKAGKLDVMSKIPASDFKQLKNNPAFVREYDLYSPSSYRFLYIGLNDRLPKFSDSGTRRALAHLLDIPQLIEINEYGIAQQSTGMISPADSAHHNPNIRPYPFDPEKAKELLVEAGWQLQDNRWAREQNGVQQVLSFTITYKSGASANENIALLLQEAARSIGIKTELKPVEGAVFSEALRNHNVEVFVSALRGNPYAYDFRPILHSDASAKGKLNYTGFGTPESDSLINAIATDTSAIKRVEYMYRLQEILHDEANIIYLYFIQEKIAVHSRFQNVKFSAVFPGYDISKFKLKDAK